ncbi:MAG: hypothetical protein L3J20_06425 [Flavobacteriaceae bacterium]|nr:hypothetical protein [Flavobacteriaceae bacterium]
MNNISYPIMAFDDSDPMIYVYKKNFLISTKNLIGEYKNLSVIDSSGVEYKIKKAEFEKGKGFSLLYLKKMIKVKIILQQPSSEISLSDLKIRIMNKVKLKPKFWLPVDTIEGIQEMVDKAKTYKELILIFR